MNRRTKLVATIGPACDSEEKLAELIEAGLNVARINFSHGNSDYHRQLIRRLKKIRRDRGVPLAILQDLQGPKVRIGRIAEGSVWLERGSRFVLTSDSQPGDARKVGVSLTDLHEEVEVGDHIFLADGMIELLVDQVDGTDVHCKVVVGGTLSSHKGVNMPASHVEVESMTEKDHRDLQVGLEEGVDVVALSFVRSSMDLVPLRQAIQDSGLDVRVIAKIEKPQAVDDIDAILEAADGVMIARGDLGIEIALERVPVVQKMIIRKANAIGKPVITATQMLVHMVDNPRPTRAEAADVANAILDGTDAVMLSEETAVGSYPRQAVEIMDRIAREVEGSIDEVKLPWDFEGRTTGNDAISRSSYNIARGTGAKAIITPTWSGTSARLVARFRPRQPVIAATPNPTTVQFLCLCSGVVPLPISSAETVEDELRFAVDRARDAGWVAKGDLVIITGGTPLHVPGTTNFIKVERVV